MNIRKIKVIVGHVKRLYVKDNAGRMNVERVGIHVGRRKYKEATQ